MSRFDAWPLISLFCAFCVSSIVVAQGPPTRRHTQTQSSGVKRLVPATTQVSVANQVNITVEEDFRVIRANGIPDHKTGRFPNNGNPHQIVGQNYTYRIPANPKPAARTTPLGMHNFGIAINGVPFDPGAAEWYLGQRTGGWQYEALSGAVPLGLDASYAHVQPTGAYHYHGLPTELLKKLDVNSNSHSPLIGWAADGFPIYALYGFDQPKDATSQSRLMKSSYRVKEGTRPRKQLTPSGRFDGTFIADYEYVEGLGDLDQCNGRFCVTPDFPDGTYAYFLTSDWPVVPRIYRGTPSADFQRRGPNRQGPPGRRGPPRRRR
ncbi:MAG: YHYH protein [Planctomycetota bacterium]